MSFLFDKYREGIAQGKFILHAPLYSALLIDDRFYTPSKSEGEFRSEVRPEAIMGDQPMKNVRVVNGNALDADDVTFPAVTSNVPHGQVDKILLYEDTGDPATSRLVGCIDSGVGLPVSPNGGDIKIAWDDGAGKIFLLGSVMAGGIPLSSVLATQEDPPAVAPDWLEKGDAPK